MKTHTRSPPRHRRHPRGQAMVEYSFLNWILVLALIVMMSVPLFGKMNAIDLFLRAYQSYYDSFYFALNLPFP